MSQRSHHDSFGMRPRCSFLRTLWSVVYRHVSSANMTRWIPRVSEGSILYKLCTVGDRTELNVTSARLSWTVDVYPSAKTLNVLSEMNELIILKLKLGQLVQRSMVPYNVKGFFDIQEHRSSRKTVTEIQGRVLPKPTYWNVVLWRARKPNWSSLLRALGLFLE